MTERTAYGEVLQGVVDLLSSYARDDELVGEEWMFNVAAAVMTAPGLSPLDVDLYEMLLEWSAVDLGTADGLDTAVAWTKYMQGTGLVEFRCAHDEAHTALCELLSGDGHEDARQHGVDTLADGTLRPLLELREAREALLRERYPEDGEPQAA